MTRRIPIHRLILMLNLLVLVAPLTALALLRLYQTTLIQHTERRLISEAVLIGEIWRDAYLNELDLPAGVSPGIGPPGLEGENLFPIDPLLTGRDPVLPYQSSIPAAKPPAMGPALSAGRRITAVLARAQKFNLTAAKVVNPSGLVIASTGDNVGRSLLQWREVRDALAGRYAAVARERPRDSPSPPVWSIQRRGNIRVFVAVPIFSGGRVIGAVSMSRTIMGPIQGLWPHRFLLVGAFSACIILILSLTFFFSKAISKPMERLTRVAQGIAAGRRGASFTAHPTAPREIHELGGALDVMTTKLDERARYIKEFTANVSHELKTPITAIKGAVELLRDNDMSLEQRLRFLTNIDLAAGRMQRQVAQLLFLAGIENGDPPKDEVPVVIAVEEILAGFEGELEWVVESDPGTVIMEPAHFESAVGNLVSNALRHGEGKPVTVTLAKRGSDRFSLEVLDHGGGISPANMDKIFTRFFTTERDHGGTGLGLAVVNAVARANGGHVKAVSDETGTRFTLILNTKPNGSGLS